MTDAELDKLKLGDRVLWNEREYTVSFIDRRCLVLQRDDGPILSGVHASEVTIVAPPEPVVADDDSAFRSLDSRWRALTDEVLAVLQIVTAEHPLDTLSVTFDATRGGASAKVWRQCSSRTPQEEDLVVLVASCGVGLTIKALEGK